MASLALLAVSPLSTGQELDQLISPGPLHRAHSELKGLTNCSACHGSGKGLSPEKCLACHKDLAQRAREARGFHADKKDRCFECHHEHQGENFTLIRWDPARFDHRETGYPLEGLHAAINNCDSCHTTGNAPERKKTRTFFLNDARCVACHEDVHKGQLGGDCRRCHGVDVKFRQIRFDHAVADFALTGAHTRVDCARCHPNKRWKPIAHSRCIDCHTDQHRPSLGSDCERCHQTGAWKTTSFDHNRTAFPLTGAHRRVDCSKCHRNQQWKPIPHSRCTDCHEDQHRPTLGNDCQRCHHNESWKVPAFNHDSTRYPLRGLHRSVECSKCHQNHQFAGIAFANCTDCHDKDPHLGQFAVDCSGCHVVDGFKPTTFDHAQSSYPLTGKHQEVKCGDCHRPESASFPKATAEAVRYKPIDHACATCHKDIHLGQMQKACSACHTTEGFKGPLLTFRHNEDSRFALLGKHSDVACTECHTEEHEVFPAGVGTAVRYRPLPDQCRGCHGNVHDPQWWTSSKNVLKTDCEQCHTVDTFVLEHFDHNRTKLPLTGKHKGLTCGHCHDTARWKGHEFPLFQESSKECVACHRSPHMKGLERCEQCHTTVDWKVKAW